METGIYRMRFKRVAPCRYRFPLLCHWLLLLGSRSWLRLFRVCLPFTSSFPFFFLFLFFLIPYSVPAEFRLVRRAALAFWEGWHGLAYE
ncbi:hypothetical protein GE21DRAFT_1049183 [Neurospora crassa]|nr:hypothetical protein GE21DRAFT_1049183 [Neurospora crassa]